jgi:hypothetical protein
MLDFTDKQIAGDPILQFFNYKHLPETLQPYSKPFGDLAHQIVTTLPRNSERTVALRKLLEAKDAAVRARVLLPPIIGAASFGEPVEINRFDIDRDGPPPFSS